MFANNLRVAKACLLLLIALTIATITKPVWADPPPLDCYNWSFRTGTGCINQSAWCNWFQPNFGIDWTTGLQCCYDKTTHNLVSAIQTSCTQSFNNGCCFNLDHASHCSATYCYPNYTPPS
ncbi:MAG: hypothetical protein NT023_00980 [Armatimonadetes bacterium]|nr:hypothetical protein [Armatimonadota bacterium]